MVMVMVTPMPLDFPKATGLSSSLPVPVINALSRVVDDTQSTPWDLVRKGGGSMGYVCSNSSLGIWWHCPLLGSLCPAGKFLPHKAPLAPTLKDPTYPWWL